MSFDAFRKLKDLPGEVWVLSAATLVNRAGVMALPFLVLYLTKELRWSGGWAGGMLSVYGVTSLIASPLSGKLSDRFGPSIVMRCSLFLSGTVLVLFPLFDTRAWIICMTIAFSGTAELFRPASLSIIADTVSAEQRKPAFALYRLAINLGMSVGPALGGFLAKASFPMLFVVDGVTSLLAGVVLVFGARRLSRLRAGGVPHTKDGAPAVPSPSVLRDRRFLWFLLASLPVGIVFFQHESAMPLFMVRDLKLDEALYGLMFTINTLLIVAIEVPLNAATAHWTHRRSLGLGALLVGVGFGALGLTSGAWGVAATVVVWTFGEMILFPALSAYVSEIAPPEKRGAYMGIWSMSFGVAFATAPWLGVTVLERHGASVLWAGVLVTGLISAAMMFRVQSRA